jgi:hypothetical protein
LSLTGHAFQWLTIAIALACTAAIVVLWNKVRGPRPARIAGRVGMLILGYLTTAVAVLVSVNIAYGGLIASWGDLFDNLRPPHGTYNQHHDRHQPPTLPIAEPSTAPTRP